MSLRPIVQHLAPFPFSRESPADFGLGFLVFANFPGGPEFSDVLSTSRMTVSCTFYTLTGHITSAYSPKAPQLTFGLARQYTMLPIWKRLSDPMYGLELFYTFWVTIFVNNLIPSL